MHNLFSNEEEGLDKIHDGRFPAHPIPFILSVPVATLSRGRHLIKSSNSRYLGAFGLATSTWNVPLEG
jgi:hypothetical protein